MDAPGADASLLQWAIGGVATLCAIVGGHMHVRITRVEDDTRAAIAESDRKRAVDEAAQWEAINANRRDADVFARNVVTKEDLRDFERRLMAAIRGRASDDAH